MRVFLYVPATGLESAASGVCVMDVDMRRCTSPGAGRSIKGEIACEEWDISRVNIGRIRERTSGVRSLTPKPVPPVVKTQSTSPLSHHPLTVLVICHSSSGT